jgi:HAD superfamily hydrolase (TIGR01509 family)
VSRWGVPHHGRVIPLDAAGAGGHELAAVLFDMDGTLVDSEKVWDVGLNELAARYGGALSAAARRAMVGTSTALTMRLLHDDLGQPWRDPVEGAAWLDERVRELFALGLEWRPGARELIAAVRAAPLPAALVTNTKRSLVEVALGTLGRDTFDVVVCGDEVTSTKPHPEPYLAAAAALGVAPGACVAIEDSPAGVASARAAGCRVIAVPHDVELTEVEATVVASLTEIDLGVLRLLCAGAYS